MALETGTFISDLVPTNPVGSDPLAFADDHLRLLKSTIKNSFPNITGAVTKTHTQLNNTLDKTGDTMTGVLTLSGNASSALHAVPKQQLDSVVAAVTQALYPVGSIYINAGVTTNPATLLGFGTWVAFGAGRVMVGLNVSDTLFDTLEETGGSKDAVVVSHTHTATVTDPGHSHTADLRVSGSGYTNGGNLDTFANVSTSTSTTGVTVTNSTTGSSGTNANLQPYITVAMWKRTA
jgi:hypothetical protein